MEKEERTWGQLELGAGEGREREGGRDRREKGLCNFLKGCVRGASGPG